MGSRFFRRSVMYILFVHCLIIGFACLLYRYRFEQERYLNPNVA